MNNVSPCPARARERGISLVEILIAMGVFAVALLVFLTALMAADTTRESAREQAIAYNSARLALERLRNTQFNQIFSTYKAGGTQGDTFGTSSSWLSVNLSSITGVPVGQVSFPTTNGNLSEIITDTDWGMPRDLNGNGNATDSDVSATYRLLPVRITLQWQGCRGATRYVINSFIAEKY